MSKLTNKQRIEQVAERLNLTMGCWSPQLDTLSETAIRNIVANIEFEADTLVHINRRKYIVEIDIVETELDLSVITLADYEDRYGEWVS